MTLKLDQLHAASKIICSDGTEGIQSAIEIVGRDVAVGMLIQMLRQEHNRNHGWPQRPDTIEWVNGHLKQCGIM